MLSDFGVDLDGRERFATLAKWFGEKGLPVPEIYNVPQGCSWLVQEAVMGNAASKVRWSNELEEEAARIADGFPRCRDWPETLPLLEMDGNRLRFELSFFRVHFLEGFLNVATEDHIRESLKRLGEQVASYPRALAHRDFHSDNLILERDTGRLRVVDFQDALLAPRAYDMASMAVDAYREVSPAEARRWMRRAGDASGCGEREFQNIALQRALKALGTFGFQVTRRKNVRYLPPIARTVRYALRYMQAPSDEWEPVISALRQVEVG